MFANASHTAILHHWKKNYFGKVGNGVGTLTHTKNSNNNADHCASSANEQSRLSESVFKLGWFMYAGVRTHFYLTALCETARDICRPYETAWAATGYCTTTRVLTDKYSSRVNFSGHTLTCHNNPKKNILTLMGDARR